MKRPKKKHQPIQIDYRVKSRTPKLSELSKLSKIQMQDRNFVSLGYHGKVDSDRFQSVDAAFDAHLDTQIEFITKMNVRRMSNQRQLNAGLGCGKSTDPHAFMIRKEQYQQ